VRWQLTMTTADCTVELDIRCHGRAYEYWTLDAGVRMYCYQVCTCEGFVQIDEGTPQGRRVDFHDHLMLNSFNRTVLVRQERIDGARYD
jgi:hypothetical protein